jgi:hypothetical protein
MRGLLLATLLALALVLGFALACYIGDIMADAMIKLL